MKVADIERFASSLEEFDIPMRDKAVLHISRDDATELAIDLVSTGIVAAFPRIDPRMWKSYIDAGIAYRLFRGISMIYGMRIIVDE